MIIRGARPVHVRIGVHPHPRSLRTLRLSKSRRRHRGPSLTSKWKRRNRQSCSRRGRFGSDVGTTPPHRNRKGGCERGVERGGTRYVEGGSASFFSRHKNREKSTCEVSCLRGKHFALSISSPRPSAAPNEHKLKSFPEKTSWKNNGWGSFLGFS